MHAWRACTGSQHNAQSCDHGMAWHTGGECCCCLFCCPCHTAATAKSQLPVRVGDDLWALGWDWTPRSELQELQQVRHWHWPFWCTSCCSCCCSCPSGPGLHSPLAALRRPAWACRRGCACCRCPTASGCRGAPGMAAASWRWASKGPTSFPTACCVMWMRVSEGGDSTAASYSHACAACLVGLILCAPQEQRGPGAAQHLVCPCAHGADRSPACLLSCSQRACCAPSWPLLW